MSEKTTDNPWEKYKETLETLQPTLSEEDDTPTFEDWLWDVARRVSKRVYQKHDRFVFVTTYVLGPPVVPIRQGIIRLWYPPTGKQLNVAIHEATFGSMILELDYTYVDHLTREFMNTIGDLKP